MKIPTPEEIHDTEQGLPRIFIHENDCAGVRRVNILVVTSKAYIWIKEIDFNYSTPMEIQINVNRFLDSEVLSAVGPKLTEMSLDGGDTRIQEVIYAIRKFGLDIKIGSLDMH